MLKLQKGAENLDNVAAKNIVRDDVNAGKLAMYSIMLLW